MLMVRRTMNNLIAVQFDWVDLVHPRIYQWMLMSWWLESVASSSAVFLRNLSEFCRFVRLTDGNILRGLKLY